MILKAVRALLVADTTLTDMLATYDFGSGDVPAVFTTDPMPSDTDYPAIVLNLSGGTTGGTRGSTGLDGGFDLRIYGNKGQSTQTIRDVAWRAHTVLHRAKAAPDGWDAFGLLVDPPVPVLDPDGFPGLRLSGTMKMLKA